MTASIVIPSFLGPYRHAATAREDKLIRAVESAIMQDYKDTEIIVVADGCNRTVEIIQDNYGNLTDSINIVYLDKQPMFSGNVRNAGIEAATGDVICYLDADDYIGADHVSTVMKHFTGDWVWFNDLTLIDGRFVERECALKLGQCGTSNIAHRRGMHARWHEHNTYGRDDWNFIQELQNESEGVKIPTPSYIVCHIPYYRGYDV